MLELHKGSEKMKLNELIQTHYNDLSKGQKRVATFVIENPKKIAMASAQDVGSEIGVSETTVIRFCYSLKLSGYAELQKVIREQLFHESMLTMNQQSGMKPEQQPHFFAKVMERDQAAIADTMKQIKEEDFDRAIERLSRADTVYILGLRSSFTAANWLSYTLGLVRGNVRLLRPETEDVIQTLSQMNDASVVIVISFRRYLKETIQIAELAQTQQAFIIGITDSVLSPIAVFSHLLFPIYSADKSPIDARVALFSFMNAMVAGLSVKDKDSFEKRQETYSALTSDFLFIEGEE
jgi:DNA-binding MurR/RpiR family transcriptional regulator